MRTHRPIAKQQNRHLPFGVSLIAALIAGLSFVLSLAPYGLWVVAILSPLLLYALLLPIKKAYQGWLIGWVYGFGLWATGAFWLYSSIHDYGNVSPPLALVLIALMAMIMGLFHAVMAWVFVRFLGRQPLAFASLWVLQEWLKTWLLTGFPWLFVGYAYSDLPFVVSLAPVVGVLGIGFVSVFLSASMVELARQRVGYLLMAVLLLGLSLSLWLLDPAYTKVKDTPLSVSLVQGNVPQQIKWDSDYQNEILATYFYLSQNEWGQDLVVWPEAAIPLFQDEVALFLDELSKRAKTYGTSWITGIPYKELNANQAHNTHETNANTAEGLPPFYNAVMAFGVADGVYKKQHLVPFGEYIPFSGLFNILPNLAGNQTVLNHSAGSANQPPLFIKGNPMGVAICYEVAYPNTTRLNAKNSDFLLTVSNDAWFGTSAGPHQHLQMVRMRSLETGKWFVRATNNGITAIIDHKGHLVEVAPQFERLVLRGQVNLMTGLTPYGRFGDYPLLIVSVLLCLVSIWAERNGRYFAKDGKYHQDYR